MKIYYSKRNILLVAGIFLSFSYLFQIYFRDIVYVHNAVVKVTGGSFERNLIKLLGFFLICLALRKTFSLEAFKYNIFIKLPLLYYMITIIVITPIIFQNDYLLTNPHKMTLNLIILFPLLFIDFKGENGDELFSKIIKIIIWIVCLQLIIDLLIKFFNYHYVGTILGGMGNANTFGIHLIIASLGLRFIYKKILLSTFVLLFTFATASLISSIIAIILILNNLLFVFFKKKTPRDLIIILALIIISILFAEYFFNKLFYELNLIGPFEHVFKKFRGAIYDIDNLGSFRGRIVWIQSAIDVMLNNPLSIIIGHAEWNPLKTGDGFYLTLLSTLGLPAMLFFVISHIYIVKRGINEQTQLSRFATYVLVVYLIFFSTNRILDYWPSGFIYLITINYLLRKKNNT